MKRMVGHVIHNFCDDERYKPRFSLEPSNGLKPISRNWVVQCLQAERIDPEPTGFRAIRSGHPDIKHPGLPDLLAAGSIPVVCDTFRQIVQELEPGTHQFIPTTLHDEREQLLPGSYWVMNVLQVRDCIITVERIRRWDAEGHILPDLVDYWRQRYAGPTTTKKLDLSRSENRTPSTKVVYVDRSRIQGLHLWRPKRSMYWIDFFFSDELLQRVTRAKLRKLTARPVVEMSVPIPG